MEQEPKLSSEEIATSTEVRKRMNENAEAISLQDQVESTVKAMEAFRTKHPEWNLETNTDWTVIYQGLKQIEKKAKQM